MHPLKSAQMSPASSAPIDFECPFCEQNLSAPPELFGQTLACPSCSNVFVVPVPSVPTAVATLRPPPAQLPAATPTLWNPAAVVLWSILLTPAFGSYLLAKNSETLGRVGEGRHFKFWLCLSVPLYVFAIVSHAHVGIWPLIFFLVWYLVAAMPHEKFVKKTYGKNYVRGSWGAPLAGCISMVVIVVVFMSMDVLSLVPSRVPLGGEILRDLTPNIPTTRELVEKVSGVPGWASADQIFEKSGDEALEEARKFMVGTWNFSEPVGTAAKGWHWYKFVVNADGTLLFYMVTPAADDWGKAESLKWEMGTGKFGNTGERYYVLTIVNTDEGYRPLQVFISRDGPVALSYSAKAPLPLSKGDAFPFSK